MAIKWGKTERKRIVAVLEQDWETVEDAAEAALQEALAILEERGRHTVVGQLRYSPPLGGYIDKDDADASKVCLGLYSSRAEAEKAATSLVYTGTTSEAWLTWVLDVEHSTPHELGMKRKEQHRLRVIEARKGAA